MIVFILRCRSLEVIVEPGVFNDLQKIRVEQWTTQQAEERMREYNREMTVCVSIMYIDVVSEWQHFL